MKKLLQSLLLIMAIVGFCSPGVKAENFPTDGSAITLGETYEVEKLTTYKATLKITETGVLLQEGCPELIITELGASNRSFVGYCDYGQIMSWKVEEGKTYTIECNRTIDRGKVCFTMESAKAFEKIVISPKPGEVLSPNSNRRGTIDIGFGSSVTCDAAYLVAGDAQKELSELPATDNYLSFEVRSAMNQMYASGALNSDGGTAVTLKIEGLKTTSGILYNGDGVFECEFIASPRLVDLVSKKLPSTFKSYYPEGDAEGVLEFVFDRDLIDDGSIYLLILCGNQEVDQYREEIIAAIDGPKASVNLCGKYRDLNSFIADGGIVELRLSNVKDINGLEAAGAGDGSQSTYAFTLPYQYLPPVNLVSEFSPASGSSLQGVESIEIWFNNADAITFDGVKITYEEKDELKTIILPNDDLSIVRAGNDVTITFDVPEVLQGKTGITVSLNNIVSQDGQEYNISAEYDQFVVQLLSPVKPGEAIASTGDTDFVFVLNVDDTLPYIRYDFYNGEEDNNWAGGAQLYKADNGTYTAYNQNYKCYTDFEPYMIVSAYYNENFFFNGDEPAASYRIDFKGTTKPFEFSDLQLVDIDPAPNSVIDPTDDFCWTIQFTGLVAIDEAVSGVLGSGGIVPFRLIEPVDPTEDMANTWRLYPSEGFWGEQQNIEINIAAHDMDGNVIEGNTGFKQYSSFQFSYEVNAENSYRDLTVVPAAESAVSEISEFILSYEDMAVGINYGYTGSQKVTISNADGEVIYEFGEDNIEVIAEETGVDELGQPIYSEISQVKLTVDPAITEEGSYVLSIPANYFTIGAQFSTYGNMAFEGTYYIGENPNAPVALTVTPEGGEVTAITRIDITAPGIEDAICNGNENITITNADGEDVYVATPEELSDTSFDMETWTFLGYFIEPNIETPGVYTLNIPAGFFTFADDTTSAALEVVYTISTSGITAVGVEKADNYTVYTIAGVLVLDGADAAALSTLAPGIYVINGKKVLVK